MSGGVDSSVAAALLVEEGHRVFGITMKLWCYAEDPSAARACCSLAAVEVARSVAARIGIPHYVVDMEEGFDSHVVRPFCLDYANGRTPNPCVVCNTEIKFKALMDRVFSMGADFLATGHYANLERTAGGAFRLARAADRGKDQSYVLWGIEKSRLPKILFPLGRRKKREVRAIASRLGLASAGRQESQDVCFAEPDSCGDFVVRRLREMNVPVSPGSIVGVDGSKLGTHPGVAHFTIGQRRGLGVSSSARTYVVALRPESNTVVLGPKSHLLAREFLCSNVNWLDDRPRSLPRKALVQIRYTHTPADAVIDEVSGGTFRVRFADEQSAITPGQSAVFYEGDVVLGGGVIAEVLR
ncbi:MAG: tRNA 2-thiouridine(34) synthase MnmA [Candidatus Eiseniibacteriota bacterium]|nr:MAG: tRNA 2-thiouridine(34) synthase MnmA [Candidatus Eisenbacteria bacterium]